LGDRASVIADKGAVPMKEDGEAFNVANFAVIIIRLGLAILSFWYSKHFLVCAYERGNLNS
jgi:hypothetical protein